MKTIRQIRLNTNQGLQNITDDPDAPLLYRNKFIFFYGAIFSVLAGGILMSINFYKLGLKKNILPTLLFATTFGIIQSIALNLLSINITGFTLAVSLLGMYLLETLIWNKKVDQNLKYRKRPVLGAMLIGLMIALILIVPLIFLSISASIY